MDLVFAPSQIELWPIEKLRPYAKNAKIHGEVSMAAGNPATMAAQIPATLV